MHIIELSKAEKHPFLPEALRAWITCLLHNLDEAAMSTITHTPVKEALKHLDTLYSNEEARMLAQRRAQALVDYEDKMAYIEHKGREDGQQQGLQQGLQQGAQKGTATLLELQLSRKFGPLPAEIASRLREADTEQLQAWSLNLLDADTLSQVFSER